MGLPRVIWTYWAQGWDNAPPVAQISRRAWAACNPNWTLTPLDNASLDRFLPADLCQWVRQSPASWAAKSDRLRLELLRRYGGVWVDATTLPNQPLDLWLPEVLGAGFFAFWQPGAGRPIASWFLVSEPQGEVISEWSRRCDAYWSDRAQADNYFWVHTLFGDMLSENGDISAICARMPKIGAANTLHFGPDSDRLSAQPTQQDIADLIVPPVPVTKLTHKQQDTGGQGSLFHRLLARANRYPAIYRAAPDQQTRKRILLTWYGSEAGHGTLGDQRSAEAAATALVAAGHDVVVSSSVALDVPGVSLQDWRTVSPDAIDGLVFVCGLILAQHEVLTPIIAKFRNIPKCGCGVSILAPDNPRHWQPFDCLIAREGGPVRFGDIAALAPQRRPRTEPRNRLRIGLCLRGAQIEYGAQNALAQETETLGRAIIQKIAGDRDYEIVEIETHLVRSGLGADGIVRQLADCDILITSRFHGAIFAILHEIPCVVLDQIRGGEKLTALLGDVPALSILRTDQATISQVSDVIRLLNRQTAADRRRLRMGAETAARRSLGFLRGWVNGL